MSNTNWEKAYKEGDTPWRKKKVDLGRVKKLVPSGYVLDLGCGTGEISKWFYDNGYRVDAVDFAPAAIETAKRDNPGPNYFVYNLDSKDIGSKIFKERYDIIVDFTTYHFIKNKEAYLDFVRDKLKGIYFIKTVLVHKEKPSLEVDKIELENLLQERFKFEKKTNEKNGVVFVTYVCRLKG